MTTKDCSLPFKDKQDFVNNKSASNEEYNNLNLNQNNQNSSNVFSGSSKSISTEKRKDLNYGNANAVVLY